MKLNRLALAATVVAVMLASVVHGIAADGLYYDVAYDRSLDPPASTTGTGLAGGTCTPYAAPTGTTTDFDQGIEFDDTMLNGGAPGAALIQFVDASILSMPPSAKSSRRSRTPTSTTVLCSSSPLSMESRPLTRPCTWQMATIHRPRFWALPFRFRNRR